MGQWAVSRERELWTRVFAMWKQAAEPHGLAQMILTTHNPGSLVPISQERKQRLREVN